MLALHCSITVYIKSADSRSMIFDIQDGCCKAGQGPDMLIAANSAFAKPTNG